MGKVYWHEAWECWARKIKLNEESVIIVSKNKQGLDKMSYRISREILDDMNINSLKN